MKNIKTVLAAMVGFLFLSGNAFASQSSTILVMSSQLNTIAKDLTTGMLPSAILTIAIGLWGFTHAFGKNMGDGVHQLTNIIAVGGIVFFATTLLANATIFSAVM
jgi:hypothetical protein